MRRVGETIRKLLAACATGVDDVSGGGICLVPPHTPKRRALGAHPILETIRPFNGSLGALELDTPADIHLDLLFRLARINLASSSEMRGERKAIIEALATFITVILGASVEAETIIFDRASPMREGRGPCAPGRRLRGPGSHAWCVASGREPIRLHMAHDDATMLDGVVTLLTTEAFPLKAPRQILNSPDLVLRLRSCPL